MNYPFGFPKGTQQSFSPKALQDIKQPENKKEFSGEILERDSGRKQFLHEDSASR